MIFSNMAYPGKDYRVLVYDSWLGEDFHSLDNPQDGDKIVYREMGEDGQPKVTKTEVYSNGEWAEEGSGGGDDGGGDGGDGGGYKKVTVTLHSSNDGEVIIYAPYEEENQSHLLGIFDFGTSLNTGLSALDGENFTVTADLEMLGDSASCYFYGDYVSSSGSVVHDEENYQLIISGNCEVTLANND